MAKEKELYSFKCQEKIYFEPSKRKFPSTLFSQPDNINLH